MRPIFNARHRTFKRPWWRWVLLPFLLVRWAWRELKEASDELYDELSWTD